MGKVSGAAATAAIALMFGFTGAFAAVQVFAEDLRGPQGATGVPGPPGTDGTDGQDGSDGARGPRGLRGQATKVNEPTYSIGTAGCVGQSFRVVTDARVVDKRLQVDRTQVCVTD